MRFPCAVTRFSKIVVTTTDNNKNATSVRCSIPSRDKAGFNIQTCWTTNADAGWSNLGFDAVIIGY